MVRPEVERISQTIDRITFEVAGKGHARRLPARPFRSVLAATDGSEGSKPALQWARRFKDRNGSRLTVVRVVEPPGLTTAFLDRSYDRDAEERSARQEVADEARQLGAAHKVLRGYAVSSLTKLVKREEYDALLLGNRGYGRAKRALLGSVADGVKNHVPSHVLIAKAPPGKGGVVVGVDGSAASKYAAQVALHLADSWDVPCTILSVVKRARGSRIQARIQDVEEILPKPDLEHWKSRRVNVDILEGDPATHLLGCAEAEGSDLIVVGGRGLSGLRSLVPGGVANRVAHEASASVLIVKEPRA